MSFKPKKKLEFFHQKLNFVTKNLKITFENSENSNEKYLNPKNFSNSEKEIQRKYTNKEIHQALNFQVWNLWISALKFIIFNI